jgi:hypothetical protein
MRQCAMDRGEILRSEEALDHLFRSEGLGEPILAGDSPFRSRQMLQSDSFVLSDQRNFTSRRLFLERFVLDAPDSLADQNDLRISILESRSANGVAERWVGCSPILLLSPTYPEATCLLCAVGRLSLDNNRSAFVITAVPIPFSSLLPREQLTWAQWVGNGLFCHHDVSK